MNVLKKIYIMFIHLFRRVFAVLGILGLLEKASSCRVCRWVRSLFAIYDIDDLIHLDVPWWTYKAIDVVDSYLQKNPGATVYEYGSGASTIWLSKRAASVASIEHDKDWCKLVQGKIKESDNAQVAYVPAEQTISESSPFQSAKDGYLNQSFESYVKSISTKNSKFDIIVIDGRARSACLNVAKDFLSDGGILVFDNSNRKRYQSALKACHDTFDITHYGGLTVALPYPDRTTILQKKMP